MIDADQRHRLRPDARRAHRASTRRSRRSSPARTSATSTSTATWSAPSSACSRSAAKACRAPGRRRAARSISIACSRAGRPTRWRARWRGRGSVDESRAARRAPAPLRALQALGRSGDGDRSLSGAARRFAAASRVGVASRPAPARPASATSTRCSRATPSSASPATTPIAWSSSPPSSPSAAARSGRADAGAAARAPARGGARARSTLVDDWTVADGRASTPSSITAAPTSCSTSAAALAARPGPIVGVEGLRPGETALALERLVVERALSVNTAAAGGNATLDDACSEDDACTRAVALLRSPRRSSSRRAASAAETIERHAPRRRASSAATRSTCRRARRPAQALPVVIVFHGGGGAARLGAPADADEREGPGRGLHRRLSAGLGRHRRQAQDLERRHLLRLRDAAAHRRDRRSSPRCSTTCRRRFAIDRARVYATGISNGGMMAYEVGLRARRPLRGDRGRRRRDDRARSLPAGAAGAGARHPRQRRSQPAVSTAASARRRSRVHEVRSVASAVDFWRRHDGCARQRRAASVAGAVRRTSYSLMQRRQRGRAGHDRGRRPFLAGRRSPRALPRPAVAGARRDRRDLALLRAPLTARRSRATGTALADLGHSSTGDLP